MGLTRCYRAALTMNRNLAIRPRVLAAAADAGGARGVVVDAVCEHRPELPGMFIGNGDELLAEGRASVECAYPLLLWRGLFDGNRLGALQAAARTLDQQRVQVGIARAADRAPPHMATAGVLGGHQAEPRGQLPTVLERVR